MRSFVKNIYNRLAYSPEPSDKIDAVVLAAGVAKLYAIPAGSDTLLFASTGPFWARFGASSVVAAIPAADVADGTAPEYSPAVRRVPSGVTHVSLIADAACKVSISCYGG